MTVANILEKLLFLFQYQYLKEMISVLLSHTRQFSKAQGNIVGLLQKSDYSCLKEEKKKNLEFQGLHYFVCVLPTY